MTCVGGALAACTCASDISSTLSFANPCFHPPTSPEEKCEARQAQPITQAPAQPFRSELEAQLHTRPFLPTLYKVRPFLPVPSPKQLLRKATRFPDSVFIARDVGLPFLPLA